MPGPLEGVRVLDLSTMISGPLAAMLLADQGADVIKVESPGIGDLMRYLGSHRNGVTGLFANNNRGKRSIVVDLKEPRGVEVLKQLAASADVLVQNFRPGAMTRLGLGYDDLAAVNPRLIYVSISGFGSTGPYSKRRVYDNVIQAYAGYAGVQTNPATGEPAVFRTLVCDKATAYTAAQAITAALFARERGSAEGQHIELAMLDAGIAFLWPDAAMDRALLEDDTARQPTIGSNYQVTKLQDGYVVASAISDSEFAGYCAALGQPEIAEDPRFAHAARPHGPPGRPADDDARGDGVGHGGAVPGGRLRQRRARRADPHAGRPTGRCPGRPQRGVRRARAPPGRSDARGTAGPAVLGHAGQGRRAGADDGAALRRDRRRARPRPRRAARRRHHRLTLTLTATRRAGTRRSALERGQLLHRR